MAKIQAGILSKTTGKVGGVVGASWKGINYIRSRVTPKNPRTELQVAQRENMAKAVAWVKPLIGTVLTPYIDRFVRRMSAYNFVIKKNVMFFQNLTVGQAFTISKGSLSTLTNPVWVLTGATYSISWVLENQSGLLPTDNVVFVVSDADGVIDPKVVVVPLSALQASVTASPFTNTTKTIAMAFVMRFKYPDTQAVPLKASDTMSKLVNV